MSLPISFNMTPVTTNSVITRSLGSMGGFFVSAATGTITIYDGVDATGRLMLATFTPAAPGWFDFPTAYSAGLYVVITAAMPVSVAWV